MRAKPTRSRVGFLLVVAIAAAAGFATATHLAGAQESSTSARPDACTLVTKAEAEAVLGASATVTDDRSLCSFTVTAAGQFRSLSVGPGPEALTAENFATAMRDYAGTGNAAVAAADVGDEAFATIGELVSQLVARQGDKFVTVVLVNPSAPADQRTAQMAALARNALARMS